MSYDWNCIPVSVTDGDTIRAHVSREQELLDGWAQIIKSTNPRGLSLRLVTLDTPERGQPGYLEAKADVADWLSAHDSLRCETYASAGWDRLLADVYVTGFRGQTLSQHMLMLGWLPYIK